MAPMVRGSLTLARLIPMRVAEDALRAAGLTVPVDLDHLAARLHTRVVRLAIRERQLLGASWAEAGGGRVAVVNTRVAPAVQRFTLAHELMHGLLHANAATPPLQLSGEPHSLPEIEANTGAAALLAPAAWLAPLVEAWAAAHGEPLPWTAAALAAWRDTAGPGWARAAGMSLTALGFRLADLGYVASDGLRAWRAASPRWAP